MNGDDMRRDETRGDDQLERDLRSALRDLAADPAPDRLVERVQSIPFRAPASAPRRSFMRLVSALATAAVLVAAFGVLVLTRPIGGPAASGGSPAIASNGSAPSSTISPGATSTVAPSSTVPGESILPAGGAVPSGFQPVSVTFASPDLGWVLGTASCSSGACTTILRTTDGGRTWASIPAPSTAISTTGVGETSQMSVGSGVSALRFADSLDGWAFGPDLWATHDGGATWHRTTIAGMGSAPVVGLEASHGSVNAVLYETTSQPAVRVASSPADHDAWTLSAARQQIGAGPVPSSQLVLSGSGGWLLQVDRTVVGGLRLTNGAWSAWTPPCASVVGPAVLAASSPTELMAVCDVGLWSTPKGEHLYASHDGGTTFAQTGTAVPVEQAAAVASPGTGSIFVAGMRSGGSVIVGSFDGGQTWQTVLTAGQSGSQGAAPFTYLGFTTSTQGVALTQAGGTSQGTLWMTRDGGHTWARVSFGGQ